MQKGFLNHLFTPAQSQKERKAAVQKLGYSVSSAHSCLSEMSLQILLKTTTFKLLMYHNKSVQYTLLSTSSLNNRTEMFCPNLEKEQFFLLNVLIYEQRNQQISMRMKLNTQTLLSHGNNYEHDRSRKCQTATEVKTCQEEI